MYTYEMQQKWLKRVERNLDFQKLELSARAWK